MSNRKPMTWNAYLMAQAISNPCPKTTCRAEPGESCRRLDGRLMQAPHSLRYGTIPA